MSIDSVQIAEAPSKRVTVKFGSVTVHGFAPPDDEVAGNIKAGHAALSRVLKAFAKPGITLPRIKDVPLFSADPDDPITLIRELNGQSERGSLVDGKFKPY